MKNLLLAIILCLLSSRSSFAQSDYIITLSRDTVYGNISSDNYTRVYFKAVNENEEKKFSATEILGYHKGKKIKPFIVLIGL